MTARKISLLLSTFVLLGVALFAFSKRAKETGEFVAYEADPRAQQLELYWKDNQGQRLGSLQRLKEWLSSQKKQLVFATNAGMFNPAHAPQGLFIQNFKTLAPLDTAAGEGNFYLWPNGVFYATAEGAAGVCTTGKFIASPRVKYATQSGPMLLIDGRIHPAFQPNSTNQHVRNGVGLLPNGHALFVMSKDRINLYALAQYFQRRGCRQALYFDGFVSRTYCPAAGWQQLDGDFGVIVGVTTLGH